MTETTPNPLPTPLPQFESHPIRAFAAATLAVIATGLAIHLAIFLKTSFPAPTTTEPSEPSVIHPPKLYELPQSKTRTDSPNSADLPDAPPSQIPPPPLNALTLDFPEIDATSLSGAQVIQGWQEFGGSDAVAATIAELDAAPAALVQVAPQVTQIQRKLSVYAEMRVDRSGHVTSVTILETDDHRLNEPVLRAVRKWQFQPGMKDGEAVPFILRQRFQFAP